MTTLKIKGGANLESALKAIARKVEKPAKLRVGFLEDATYPNGTNVAMIAAIQNFGAPARGIPPRPFFSNMVKDQSPGWPKSLEANLKSTGYDATASMEMMGQGIASQLQDAIINTNEPPLSQITVMLRGMKANDPSLVVTGKTVGQAAARVRDGKTNYGASTKVLDDTGFMLSRVDYDVTG